MSAFTTSLPPRRSLVALALTATLAATTLSACGSSDADAAGGGNATLKWATGYFPKHWDPVVSGSGAQFRQLALELRLAHPRRRSTARPSPTSRRSGPTTPRATR